MTEEQTQLLIDTNMRLTLLVGIMHVNLLNPKPQWIKWINEAVENVCYKDLPFPEFPE